MNSPTVHPGSDLADTLRAQLPPHSQTLSLALQLVEPDGFWLRIHPGCDKSDILYGVRTNRQERADEGGAS